MLSPEAPRLHFHRYEFKYLISGSVLAGIMRELELRLERDIHSDINGSYFIRSHYFDTDKFDLFYEKLAGLRKRYKFRFRNYCSTPAYTNPLFLELKGRDDSLVFKHRLLLDPEGTEYSMSKGTNSFSGFLLDSGSINGTGKRFVFDAFRKKLSPSVVVDYRRTAFENRANPDFRVTLDSQVVAYRAGSDGHPVGRSHNIANGFQVLEIKFRYHLPNWFHRLIQEFELKRVSFSKFAHATDVIYMKSYDSYLDKVLERRPACLS